MSDPTKELIFQNEVIAEMVAGEWKRGNTGKLSSGHKGQSSGYNESNSGHNEIAMDA